jgi:hypothetical protein
MKRWTQQDTTAHRGIAKIYRVVTDMGYIWRPTANSDVGFDGEIELVEDRAATAKIIKVQVKSGASYFRMSSNIGGWRVTRYYLLSIILRKIQFSVSMYKSILRLIPSAGIRA